LKRCEECGNDFDAREKMVTRFCSKSCAGKFNGRNKPKLKVESRIKIKEALVRTWKEKGSGTSVEKTCPVCGVKFLGRKRKTCSRSCGSKLAWSDPVYRERISSFMRQAPHRGWQSRGVKSYPERFWEDILLKNGFIEGVDFVRELRITKASLGEEGDTGWYFLDFFFPRLKLDLEIDGKQHSYPERVQEDQDRDRLLERNGFSVLRLPWRGLKQGSKETWAQVHKVLSILKQEA
jgi:very-short-patch-repair endonuclease